MTDKGKMSSENEKKFSENEKKFDARRKLCKRMMCVSLVLATIGVTIICAILCPYALILLGVTGIIVAAGVAVYKKR